MIPTLRVAMLAAAALMALAGGASAKVFDPKSYTLANGMEVVVVEDRRAPVVTHMVWYRTGAADEPAGKSGIAHFLEHLMFRGTKTLAPGEFSKIVARNGGRDNAFTSLDYTGYFQEVASDRLDLVMGLEADRMVNLQITDAVVDPERLVILEERRQRIENNPRSLFGEQMTAAQFLSHRYGIPVIGWMHEMEGLTRADALDFYARHYAPNNAILVVVGDVRAENVRLLAEKHFGPIPARPEIKPRQRPKEPPQLAARRLVMEDARVREPSWSRSYLAPSHRTGDKAQVYALIVLAEVLGGSTGRLQRGLVLGDGPASSAGAWYDPDAYDDGRFGFFATPKNGRNVETVEAAIDGVIATVIRDGITAEELDRARVQLDAAAIYARDSLMNVARTIGAALTAGQTLADIEAWPERIAAVTPAEVQAAAKALFDARRSVTGVLMPKREG